MSDTNTWPTDPLAQRIQALCNVLKQIESSYPNKSWTGWATSGAKEAEDSIFKAIDRISVDVTKEHRS